MADLDRLTTELMHITRDTLVDDPDETLVGVTAGIVSLGVADRVSITERIGDHEFRTRGATDDRVTQADRLQYELAQGPCVEAAYDDGLLWSENIAQDARWPLWGPAAAALGVGAAISVHLYITDVGMGALNLFYDQPREFTHDDLEAARMVAVPVSVELAHGRQEENLWKAIDARHRVGQAQGVLMCQFGVSENEAFAVLRRLSQQNNTKLHVIADQIIRNRKLPAELGTAADIAS